MSNRLHFDLEDDDDDIDALNDETFGCDINDINDDWEEEHEKNASVLKDIDLNRSVDDVPKNSSFISFSDSSRNLNFEDIVKKSLSDVILDDEDIYPNFISCDVEINCDLDSSKNNDKNSKIKNINLESLRPPSPSILPSFDDPFMSNVWRPLSPELNTDKQDTNVHSNSIQSLFNDSSRAMTLEQLESSIYSNGHKDFSLKNENVSKTKAIRLEDLEANLHENKFDQRLNQIPFSSSVNFTNSGPTLPQSIPTSSQSKMAPNLMEFAPISLNQIHNAQLPIIPKKTKVVPPPPGLGHPFKVQVPSMPVNSKSASTMTFPKCANPTHPQVYNLNNSIPCSKSSPTISQPMLSMLQPKVAPLPVILDPLVQQEQQRIINKIITPAQAQRSYPPQINNLMKMMDRNKDHYAGFMTQKEKEWLLKIFRLQCKVNDPYGEDFYEVNYNLKKSLLQKRQNEMKQNNRSEFSDMDSIVDTEPLCVLPELAKVEIEKPKYIQFDNALGKIQVLNSKCPRKLLDIDQNCVKEHLTYKLDLHNQYLLKIERLYELILKIEDEDKRMPILPQDKIMSHVEKRAEFCKKLFNGLIKNTEQKGKYESAYFSLINRNMPTLKKLGLEVDPQILQINKGLFLVYRSLFQLREEDHILILLISLFKYSNFEKYVLQSEAKSKTCYGNILIKATSKIVKTQNLIYLAASIDDIKFFTSNKVNL